MVKGSTPSGLHNWFWHVFPRVDEKRQPSASEWNRDAVLPNVETLGNHDAVLRILQNVETPVPGQDEWLLPLALPRAGLFWPFRPDFGSMAILATPLIFHGHLPGKSQRGVASLSNSAAFPSDYTPQSQKATALQITAPSQAVLHG